MLAINMGIDLSSADISVSKKFFDGHKVGTPV
jgi:hypothetical protein